MTMNSQSLLFLYFLAFLICSIIILVLMYLIDNELKKSIEKRKIIRNKWQQFLANKTILFKKMKSSYLSLREDLKHSAYDRKRKIYADLVELLISRH